MSGLGGLNKSPHGVVIGLAQLQLPTVVTSVDLSAQVAKIVSMVSKAKRGMPTLDLVVFPEYALHGLSMDTNPAIMCRIDGPEVAAFKEACAREHVWGCFSVMEHNPHGNPYNSGIIIDAAGELRLYYRKMHPWTPVDHGNRAIWEFRCATGPMAASWRSSSATTACFPRWLASARTRAPTSC